MNKPIIVTKNVRYTYGDGFEAVKGVGIEIEAGKKISFVGPNGAGKSTLFLMFNGIHVPTEGEILFNGEKIKYDSKSLVEIRKRVGMVFQNPDDQLFAPTLFQDVAFGPKNLGWDEDKVKKYTELALDYVNLLHIKDKPPHHLSGGQKKRAAIAGILVMEPDVLILDEPLSNLDPKGASEVMDMLNELNSYGKTIIISTHDIELAYQWSDYVYLMADGKIVGQGTPDCLFKEKELIKKTHLKTPLIIQIYHELAKRNLVTEGQTPKNLLELVGSLKPSNLKWSKISSDKKVGDLVEFDDVPEDHCCKKGTVLYRSKDNNAIVEFHNHQTIGEIYIYNTDFYDFQEVQDTIVEYKIQYVGAMGSKSKSIASKDNINLDVNSNVIDKTILTSLSGRQCLILTSGGMVGHTEKRIKSFVDETSLGIKCRVVNSREILSKSMW